MKLNIFKTLALGVLTMGFVACDEDFTKADYDAPIASAGVLPTVTTGEVGAFGESAIIDASMTLVEGAAPTNWGVLVSTSAEPTLAGSIKVEGDITKTSQKFAVSGLTDKTHYYYRTFVSDGVSVAFGETKEFTTDGEAWGSEQGYWSFATAAEADAYLPYRAMLGATHSSAFGFTTCNMAALYGQEFYGVASTMFDPNKLFNQLSGSLATYGVMNAAGFKMDFTGMYFPKVWFDATMIQMYFGATDYPGHFDVYVSKEPITDAAGLQTAVKVGSSKGTGKAQELYATNMETSSKEPMKFDIPMDYWGETYIYIVSTADYTGSFSGETSYGIVVFGYGLDVTVPKEATEE
jgi:hypothetical protein